MSVQNDIRIRYYDPVHNRDLDYPDSIYPPFEQTSEIDTQGIRELRSFIRDITKYGRWVQKKKKLKLCDPETNKEVIQFLCGRSSAVCEES